MEDFDGIVWFTRTVEWPAKPPARTLALGRVGNAAQVWVNGRALPRPPAAPGGWRAPVTYALPDGVLRPGTNTITVRIRNVRREGGFLDTPDAIYIEGGKHKVALAGTWKYRPERQTNAAALYNRPGELAAHVARAAAPDAPERGLTVAEPTPAAPPDVAVKLGVIPHQLKFDQPELTVTAGQFVELVFMNSDVMQHNFLLGAQGSLERIGTAADAMMTGPDGLAQQYVPPIPEVLFATALVDPGQTLTVQFKVPEQPGDYPYVCTFPGHWRVMNGIMHVKPPRTVESGAAAGSPDRR
jgi:azurin